MKLIFTVLIFLASTHLYALGLDSNQAATHLILSGHINNAKGVDIPTASVVDLNSVAGNLVHVTGATTITSFGTASQAGICRHVIFDSTPSIAYNASTLVVPGSTTFSAAAGDHAFVCADSATKWIILDYQRKATAP